MKVVQMNLGVLRTNCYLAISDSGNAVMVDIGGDGGYVIKYLQDNGIILKKILLTHGHFDHIWSVEEVRRQTGADVYIHSADVPKLSDIRENLGYDFGLTDFEAVTQYNIIEDGSVISLDEMKFRVMHTPGHTEGSVCYITDGVIFSGDTLFRRSQGRTDFPDGDDYKMQCSLKKLSQLDGNYTVYPGHDFTTELDYERQNNPYMVML